MRQPGQIHIGDLGGVVLGLASSSTIWLDDNAAGWGWFVGPLLGTALWVPGTYLLLLPQFLVTGVLGPQSNAHGPNEFLHVPTGRRLTACVARPRNAVLER